VAFCGQLLGHPDGLVGAAERVVGVDEQHHVVGKGSGERQKGVHFPAEAGDIGVGHGAKNRNPINLSRQHVAGADEACEIAGAGHLYPRINAVGTAE